MARSRQSEIDETDGGAPDQKRIDLDDFFPYVGEYGKFQKLLTWLIVLPACIPCGLQGFNQLFMADDVAHWCRLPEFLLTSTNFTKEQLKLLAIPKDPEMNKTSSCFIRNVSWSELSFFQRAEEYIVDERPNSEEEFQELREELENIKENTSVISCPYGFDYEFPLDSHYSIVQDFDLVCGYEVYPTLSLLLFNIGGVIGVFLFGILTDVIGRKASFFVCLSFEMVGGIGCVFAPNFWIWTLFRVLIGLTVPAIYQIPFIICLELVGQTYRSFLTVMTCLFYVGGMMLLPLVSWLERDWRLLSLYTTVPFLLYFVYIKYLPESPRWLMSQKRAKEAVDILETLAKVNGTELPEKLKERLSLQNEKSVANDTTAENGNSNSGKASHGLKDLFRTPNLRLKTCLLTFCWFANATVYVGLSFYGPSLGENAYLSFFLGSAVELPGYLLCWMVMDRWGRRWPLCLAMIIGGIFDIATVLLPEDDDRIVCMLTLNSNVLLMAFYLIAKFGISASYLIVYPFAGELYPTEVRGLGLGFSAYIGGIGICCIPLINYLPIYLLRVRKGYKRYGESGTTLLAFSTLVFWCGGDGGQFSGRAHLVIPLVIMGLVSVAGGLAALRLPETLNAVLPTTIEEGEEFGKDFKLVDCFKYGPTSVSSPSPSLMEDGLSLATEAKNEPPQQIQLTLLRQKMSMRSEELAGDGSSEGGNGSNNTSQDQGSRRDEEAHELSPLRGNELRRSSSKRKRLVRQGSSIMEAPTNSTGAIMITPWW